MSKSILFTAVVIVILAALAGLTIRTVAQATAAAAPRATEARPFGPGWAADYGTYPEPNTFERHY